MVCRTKTRAVAEAAVAESGPGEGNAVPRHAAPLWLVLSLGGSGAV